MTCPLPLLSRSAAHSAAASGAHELRRSSRHTSVPTLPSKPMVWAGGCELLASAAFGGVTGAVPGQVYDVHSVCRGG